VSRYVALHGVSREYISPLLSPSLVPQQHSLGFDIYFKTDWRPIPRRINSGGLLKRLLCAWLSLPVIYSHYLLAQKGTAPYHSHSILSLSALRLLQRPLCQHPFRGPLAVLYRHHFRSPKGFPFRLYWVTSGSVVGRSTTVRMCTQRRHSSSVTNIKLDIDCRRRCYRHVRWMVSILHASRSRAKLPQGSCSNSCSVNSPHQNTLSMKKTNLSAVYWMKNNRAPHWFFIYLVCVCRGHS
jgi:hypothetical protein